MGNYHVFAGKPDDTFDFFAIFDDGNRLYYKITDVQANEVALVCPGWSWEGYKEPVGMIDVPSTITFNGNSYLIKSVGSGAFRFCKKVESFRLPNTVRVLGDNAFSGCSSLSSIVLPSGLESIGDDCFSFCSFRNVSIPDTVSNIGKDAFRYCTVLESFSFPSKVSVIESGVLNGCKMLSRVEIPQNIIEIKSVAFSSGNGYYGPGIIDVFMQSVIPPKICATAFDKNCRVRVIVPKGSKDVYNTAQYWQMFDIREIINGPIGSSLANTSSQTANLNNSQGNNNGIASKSKGRNETSTEFWGVFKIVLIIAAIIILDIILIANDIFEIHRGGTLLFLIDLIVFVLLGKLFGLGD
jgi:hypothetical protein